MPAAPWRPPFWLLFLDLAGIACVALGLNLHYAPDAPLIPGLPAAMKLPLLAIGAAVLIAAAVAAVRSILAHRHSR